MSMLFKNKNDPVNLTCSSHSSHLINDYQPTHRWQCCSSGCRLSPHTGSPPPPLPNYSLPASPLPYITALTCLHEELQCPQSLHFRPAIYISKVNIRSSFLCLSLWCFVLRDSDARNKRLLDQSRTKRLVLSLSLLYSTACSGSCFLSCSLQFGMFPVV